MDDFNQKIKKIGGMNFPVGKFVVPLLIVIWLLSGIYIVSPGEVGVVQRFGEYDHTTPEGMHYHIPYPVESVQTPKVTEVRRVEIGFRSYGSSRAVSTGRVKPVHEESLMLTGDENIVDAQFTVQYQIKDAVQYLFNVAGQENTVREAAESAMREVVGKINIDVVLTSGKDEIQHDTKDLMQEILDKYQSGILILAVKLQNVQPPAEVIDAFKDVASAREDRSRYINEAEAYRNDILPKTRGQAAIITNEAQAYKEAAILKARGEAAKFEAVAKEYAKAKDVTTKRLYLETMERVMSNPDVEKLILSDEAAARMVPYLPLGGSGAGSAPARKKGGQ